MRTDAPRAPSPSGHSGLLSTRNCVIAFAVIEAFVLALALYHY